MKSKFLIKTIKVSIFWLQPDSCILPRAATNTMICQTAVSCVVQAGSPCPAWSPSFLCQQCQFLPFSPSVTFLTMLKSQTLLSISWPSTRPSIVLVNQVSCCVLWAHCNLTGFQHDTCNTLPLLSHVCFLSLRAPQEKRPYIIWLCTPNAE